MKYLTLKKLKSEMILARDILTDSGRVLLKQGSKLDDYYINYLKEHQIESICIFEDKDSKRKEITPQDKLKIKEKLRPAKRDIFKFCINDSKMNEIFDAIMENEIWKKWYE